MTDRGLEDLLAPARIEHLDALRGGTDKQVVRAHLDGGSSVVVYAWRSSGSDATDDTDDHTARLFLARSTPAAFVAAHARFQELGVPVPRLLAMPTAAGPDGREFAVVEDVGATDLAEVLRERPGTAAPVLATLARSLRRLHGATRPSWGHLLTDPAPTVATAWDVVRDRALLHLDVAAGEVAVLRAERSRLAASIRDLAAVIEPRPASSLVHGELGPEHVLLDDLGEPVMIDVEGATYLDPEWEHAWLRLRFGPHYEHLVVGGLDPHRLHLATLAQHLAYVAGPLRLRQRRGVDADAMLRIAEHHLDAVLALSDPPSG